MILEYLWPQIYVPVASDMGTCGSRTSVSRVLGPQNLCSWVPEPQIWCN